MQNLNSLTSAFKSICNDCPVHSGFELAIDFFLMPFRYFRDPLELKVQAEKLSAHPKAEKLSAFFSELSKISEPFEDILGELFMLEVSHGHLGQFFTPQPLCDMMGQMSGFNQLKDGQSVLDPACGSGRMLLAAARLNRNVRLYGADLDSLCCKMALANLLLNSLTGEIAHMDSLTNKFFESYQTGTVLMKGQYLPYYTVNTDPDKSAITLKVIEQAKSQAPTFVQGSLF